MLVELGVLLVLTLVNGVFAMSELAVVSSRKVRLQQMAVKGVPGAATALRLLDDPSRFLSTIQIGITLVGVIAGAFGGATLGDRLGAWLEATILPGAGQAVGVGVVLVAITYGAIVLGELVPKRVALEHPERVAATLAPTMVALSTAAAPFVWLLGYTTDLFLKALRLEGRRDQTITEEDVRSLITEGTLAGVFVPQEKEMIDGVLRLDDRSVRSIMTPRPDVVWLDLDDGDGAVLTAIKDGVHSRYPACRGDLDSIVGFVRSRDLLARLVRGKPLDLESAVNPPLIVPESTKVLGLLDSMKRSGRHLAIVIDEYGSIDGIVTSSDIFEAIAGDIDGAARGEDVPYVVRDDGSWLVEGWMPVDDMEQKLGLSGLQGAGDYHTLAGFVLRWLGHVPKAGESFEREGIRYEVVDMDGHRIDKVLVARRSVPPPEASPQD